MLRALSRSAAAQVLLTAAFMNAAIAQQPKKYDVKECIPYSSQKPAPGDWRGEFKLNYAATGPSFRMETTNTAEMQFKILSSNDSIEGKSFVRFENRMNAGSGSTSVTGAVPQTTLWLDIKGQIKHDEPLQSLTLSQGNNYSATQGRVTVDAPGAHGTASGTIDKGAVSGSATVTAGGRTRTQAVKSPAAGDKALMFLNFTGAGCGYMHGVVDADSIEAIRQMRAQGMSVSVTDREWKADHVDRDLDFEAKVEQLADEPVPDTADAAYIANLERRIAELAGPLMGRSDYQNCVLGLVVFKSLEAELKMLVRELQAFRQRAPHRMAAVDEGKAMFRKLDRLEYKVPNPKSCEIMADAYAAALERIQQGAREIIEGKHTYAELMALADLANGGFLGPELGRAWEIAQVNAMSLPDAPRQ